MLVDIANDGPVTIVMDSSENQAPKKERKPQNPPGKKDKSQGKKNDVTEKLENVTLDDPEPKDK